jgi:DNA-binding transcriptional MerR regulator
MQQPGPDADHGVYGISTAAELVGLGTQTLRLYEARGLVEPARTAGGTRRYSANDLDRLRRIAELVEAGLNLAGIGMVLHLEGQNAQLQAELLEDADYPTGSAAPASAAERSPVAPARTPRRPKTTT